MLGIRQDSFGAASWRSRSPKRGRTELGREENGESHLLRSEGCGEGAEDFLQSED